MIPRRLHQIWIGSKPIPEREKAWCVQMRQMNHRWNYTLHGNEALERYASDPYLKAMQSKGEKIAFISDRLRVLILKEFGGVYLDADAQPLKPLDSLPIWEKDHVDFVAGLRSPQRKEVALHRAIPIIDNTFMASAPNGRMIGRLDSLWNAAAITGENHAINGHRTGIAILEYASYDTVLLNHRFIYCETQYPESLVLHDSHNLGSWVDDPLKRTATV